MGGSVVIDGSVVEGCVVDVSEEKQKQRFFESMCFLLWAGNKKIMPFKKK